MKYKGRFDLAGWQFGLTLDDVMSPVVSAIEETMSEHLHDRLYVFLTHEGVSVSLCLQDGAGDETPTWLKPWSEIIDQAVADGSDGELVDILRVVLDKIQGGN